MNKLVREVLQTTLGTLFAFASLWAFAVIAAQFGIDFDMVR